MMQRKVLACPDCKKRFADLKTLNNHIGHTKCDGGITVSQLEILVAIGLLKPVPLVEYNLQRPIPAT